MQEKLWNKEFVKISITYFLIASSFYLLVPAIPLYLSEVLNVPHSRIGIALSSYVFALLIVRPFSGYWVDVLERKPLLMAGLITFVLIYFGYFFALTVTTFVVIRFIHGLFWGLSSVSINTTAIDVIPSTRRAEGIGFFGVNMNLAMAIAPFIAVVIYESFGFNILIACSIGMGILAIISASLIKTPPREKLDKTPPLSLDRFILVKGVPIMLNQFLMAFGYGTLVAFAILYGKNINVENVGIFFIFLASGIVVSRIIAGRLVDRGHLHKVMSAALLILAIAFTLFAVNQTPTSYSFSAFLLGLGFGTLFPSLQTIFINIAPSSQRGTANSTYLTGFDVGIGGGMLIGALLVEKLGFKEMYLITAALYLVALVIYWFNSRKIYEKWKLK
ncbi:MAG: MFS transporter [Brumimicrobium sp.]